jgi:phage shock protein E
METGERVSTLHSTPGLEINRCKYMKRFWSCVRRVALAACCMLAVAADTKPASVRRVGVDEFAKLWQDKQNLVLDVRTSKEFSAGHIPRALNLDFYAADFEAKVSKLDKSRIYLVHCASGGRSAMACSLMRRLGFPSLIDLAPGFKGWEKAGQPVEK